MRGGEEVEPALLGALWRVLLLTTGQMRYRRSNVRSLTLTIINQTNLEVARILLKTEIRERLRLYCDDRFER